MTQVFEKRRVRLQTMKELFDRYLPPDQIVRCPKCNADVPRKEVADNQSVCTQCGHHWPIDSRQRLRMIMDGGRYRELNRDFSSADPLGFPGYEEKLREVAGRTQLAEAIVTAAGEIEGHKCVVCVLDSRFLMGSMSAAVGEKITLAIEYAIRNRRPLIIFSASGGARMQEGIFSLMQMAKTSAAIRRLSDKGLLYISVLTDPTTGGVTASFASLGDVILAELGALIGFAGPRVIEQTIGEKLTEDFQRAEFMMQHGFVDAIVPRRDLRAAIGELLMLHEKGGRL